MLEITKKLFELRHELFYKLSQIRYKKKLPPLDSRDRIIVDALNKEGVYITSLDKLGLTSNPHLLKAIREYSPKMGREKSSLGTQKLPLIYTVTDLPEFYNWGSDPRLLNIIENYIGLPVAFHGVHLRRDFPSMNQFGTLLWHRDSEDRRIVKVIIYLIDVDKENGPFEYVPKSLTSLPSWKYFLIYYALWQFFSLNNYLGINDDDLKKIIPKSAWKSCPGSAGTVVIVDTANTLHHGSLRISERLALFFAYTAKNPKRPECCTQYWDDTFAKFSFPRNSSLNALYGDNSASSISNNQVN